MVYFYSAIVYRDGKELFRADGLSRLTTASKSYNDLDNFMENLKEAVIELYMKKANVKKPRGCEVHFVAFNPMF